MFIMNTSKNKQDGLNQMRLDHKVVPVLASPSAKERCPVYVLDRYISKLPKEAEQKNLCYCRTLSSVPKLPDNPWYTAVPIGRNMLQTMVHDMCEDAGIKGRKTNSSLQVSGDTGLSAAGVPERIIKSRTRHSLLEALRKYERVTEDLGKAISRIHVLTGESKEYVSAVKSEHTTLTTPDSSSGSVSYKGCVLNTYNCPPSMPYSYPPYPFTSYCQSVPSHQSPGSPDQTSGPSYQPPGPSYLPLGQPPEPMHPGFQL